MALNLAATCAQAWKLTALNREKLMMLVYATFKSVTKKQ